MTNDTIKTIRRLLRRTWHREDIRSTIGAYSTRTPKGATDHLLLTAADGQVYQARTDSGDPPWLIVVDSTGATVCALD